MSWAYEQQCVCTRRLSTCTEHKMGKIAQGHIRTCRAWPVGLIASEVVPAFSNSSVFAEGPQREDSILGPLDSGEGQPISGIKKKGMRGVLPGVRNARTGMRGVRNDSAGVASISPVLTGLGGNFAPGPTATLSVCTSFVSSLWKRVTPLRSVRLKSKLDATQQHAWVRRNKN